MAAPQWDPTALPKRPGIYTNFVERAIAAIQGGARGIVAIPLLNYAVTATAETFYTVDSEKAAVDLFGLANISSILLVLQGGAKEVLVYTMPTTPLAEDYIAMREAFEARAFNVFVYDGEYSTTEQAATKTWVIRNRVEGKHFVVVIGGDDTTDLTPATGDTRSILNDDDYIVNVVSGGVIGVLSYNSSEYAAYIAGDIAGTAINQSITRHTTTLEDVTKRMTNSQVEVALLAGSLVLFNDGEKVVVEQGIVTSGKKIRSIRARQAIATDIARTANDSYIGKLNNNADGQATLIVAIKAYLETMEVAGVLTSPYVALDPAYISTGDSVYLTVSYVEVDSIERIFLTINI